MLRYFYAFLLLLFCVRCSQPSKQIQRNSLPEVKVFLKKGDDFERTNMDSAYYYAQKAFETSEKLNDPVGRINSLNNLGYALTALGDKKLAFEKYSQALQEARAINDSVQIAKSLNFHGVFFNSFADYDTSLSYFLESLMYREALNDTLGISIVSENIGFDYTKLFQYYKAEPYLLRACKIDSMLQDTLYLIGGKINLGVLYKSQGKINKAIEEYTLALQLA